MRPHGPSRLTIDGWLYDYTCTYCISVREAKVGRDVMDKDLKQRANESADRMVRAGMTLSSGIVQELITALERQEVENAAQAEYIRFVEMELIQAQAGAGPAAEKARLSIEESGLRWELPSNQVALAGEMNN